MSDAKACPKCDRFSPASARSCDCGYDFEARAIAAGRAAPAERPVLVTAIAWLLIVGSCLDCTFKYSLQGGPVLPRLEPMQLLLVMVGTAVRITCGVALLNRQGWARHLYVGWMTVMSL